MRHHTAVEVDLGERGKGWHYASLGKRGGGPIGACAEHAPHPTEAEARACYQACLRTRVRLDHRVSWTSCHFQYGHDADIPRCPNPTQGAASYGEYSLTPLCPEHLTLEHALTALGLDKAEAGDSWQS